MTFKYAFVSCVLKKSKQKKTHRFTWFFGSFLFILFLMKQTAVNKSANSLPSSQVCDLAADG